MGGQCAKTRGRGGPVGIDGHGMRLLRLAGGGLEEFGAGADAQLLVDAGQVGFHRLDRHEQRLGRLPVGQAGRGQLGDPTRIRM